MSVDNKNLYARGQALRLTGRADNLLPVTVTYHSHGRLLLIGPEDRVRRAAVRALTHPALRLTLAVSEQPRHPDASDLDAVFGATAHLETFSARTPKLHGYLGQYGLTVRGPEGEAVALERVCYGPEGRFDLVLDLSQTALLALERPPFGYRHLSEDDELDYAVAALAELMGVFDKPRYFKLDNEACAFTARGVPGCRRCLDLCPTDALRADQGEIRIDPFLCQGLGSCASACPTGAISYQQPSAATQEDYLWRLLARYREAGGAHPHLLIAGEAECAAFDAEALPGHWLLLPVEESASVGIESWLGALAAGASRVAIALHPECGATTRQALERELALAAPLLEGAGVVPEAISVWQPGTALPETLAERPVSLPETPKGSKRERLFAAFDALHAAHGGATAELAVPAGAPYGAVLLNNEQGCTLCMGCVAVCPTRALHASQDGAVPELRFTEQDCVQCGMCEQACPERVITLAPGLQPMAEARRADRLLKAEEAACCIRCGKPFAPASLVRRIREKLVGHSHFQGAAAERLLMCEDCRVRDVFEPLVANPLDQLKV